MCTVSFLPTDTGFILTSNRDEKETRKKAVVPERYAAGQFTLLYPEDGTHKGTWIAGKNNGDVAVLLNGAFEKHEPKPDYQKSRGLVLLELIRSPQPAIHWQQIALEKIEPFTLVIFTGGNLSEYRWDGEIKHDLALDRKQAYIWSSVTLYDKDAQAKRKQWFNKWRESQEHIDSETILDFHLNAGKEDLINGFVIDRDGIMKTQSVTQVIYTDKKLDMHYFDLATNTIANRDIDIHNLAQRHADISGIRLSWKVFITRLTSWEYWPFAVIYGPIMFYWLWLSIRSRSFFFFSASNPSIQNGGFVLESKKDIYGLIPEKYIPKTIAVNNTDDSSPIEDILSQNDLLFPLIVKPDIGMRGLGVQLLENIAQLKEYTAKSRVNFLLQEFVSYPNEVGIFYCRVPGEPKGVITGIVGKEFLSVTGNGTSSVGQLLLANPRYLLQYATLRKNVPGLLNNIPADQQVIEVLPYGNHARGAKFLDLSGQVDEVLTNAIDDICRQIPGFYFGRLDIRYQSWDGLRRGENLIIIELNGAGSEPAHIYDPSHSLFFAWKEIIRHWKLLHRISQKNHRSHAITYLSFLTGIRLLRKNSVYMRQLSLEQTYPPAL